MKKVKISIFVLSVLILGACTASGSGLDYSDEIRVTLMRLNAAENQSMGLGVESKIAAIDETHALNWEGWSNGDHSPDRESERQNEIGLFSLLPDYNRTFDQMIIDPPFASVLWTARGTSVINGFEFFVQGSSFLEFDQSGKIIRSWVHFGSSPSPEDLGVGGT